MGVFDVNIGIFLRTRLPLAQACIRTMSQTLLCRYSYSVDEKTIKERLALELKVISKFISRNKEKGPLLGRRGFSNL